MDTELLSNQPNDTLKLDNNKVYLNGEEVRKITYFELDFNPEFGINPRVNIKGMVTDKDTGKPLTKYGEIIMYHISREVEIDY